MTTPRVLGEPTLEDLGSGSIVDARRSGSTTERFVALYLKFEGDESIFQLRLAKQDLNNPLNVEADGEKGRLSLKLRLNDRPPYQDLKVEALRFSLRVDKYLGWAQEEIEEHNQGLEEFARAAISRRQALVQAHLDLIAQSGLPLVYREDAPKTFAAPGITQRESPIRPVDDQPGRVRPVPQLEPALIDSFYEHILGVLRSAGRAMSRAPDTYAGWNEEKRRDVLLLMLNTHYGGQAHGEAFNAAGKTDILIRFDDRNIFICECKFWSGAKSFVAAVDQLFSYATWADSKLALVVFVRVRELTAVVARARAALADHPQFASWNLGEETESDFRATVTWPGDPDRRATLHVMFVHTPRNTPAG